MENVFLCNVTSKSRKSGFPRTEEFGAGHTHALCVGGGAQVFEDQRHGGCGEREKGGHRGQTLICKRKVGVTNELVDILSF
jgi:hypothetical protein